MRPQRVSFSVVGGILAFAIVGWAPLWAQAQNGRTLDLMFENGTVTLVAENVTLRDILVEWEKQGGTRVVNADRLGGGLLPRTEFRQEPEASVLRSLLREVPGYGAAPRLAPTASASTFEALFILPTRTVPVSGAGTSPIRSGSPAQGVVQIQQPEGALQPAPRVINGAPDNEIPPVRPIQGELPPTTPGGNQPTNPNLRVGPGGAVTSTVPGVVIPGPTTGTEPPTLPPGRGGRGRGGGGGGR